MKLIDSKNAPGAIGPYSQGFVTNGLIFTSGQLPVDPATGETLASAYRPKEQLRDAYSSGSLRDAGP